MQNIKILAPKRRLLRKLVTFVPTTEKGKLLEALHNTGAGKIGNYSECSFQCDGIGTFIPNEDANAFIGSKHKKETVAETRIDMIFPFHLESAVLAALYNNHPYEEPAYEVLILENENNEIGSGVIGNMPIAMNEQDFLFYLKSKMNLSIIRHTAFKGTDIKKVALCGGSGSFLLKNAISAGADVYISADFKYHDFFDTENKIVIADIGHYESEVFTKDLIYDFLIEKFSNIAIRLSKIDTNPISYL